MFLVTIPDYLCSFKFFKYAISTRKKLDINNVTCFRITKCFGNGLVVFLVTNHVVVIP